MKRIHCVYCAQRNVSTGTPLRKKHDEKYGKFEMELKKVMVRSDYKVWEYTN